MYELQYPKNHNGWRSRKFKVEYRGENDLQLIDKKREDFDPIFTGQVLAHDLMEHMSPDDSFMGEVAAFGTIHHLRVNRGLIGGRSYDYLPEELLHIALSGNCMESMRFVRKHPKHTVTIEDECEVDRVLEFFTNKSKFKKVCISEFSHEDCDIESLWSTVQKYKQSLINAYVRGYLNACDRYSKFSASNTFEKLEELFDSLHNFDCIDEVTIQWNPLTAKCRAKFRVEDNIHNHTEYHYA